MTVCLSNVCDEICLRSVNFERSCITHGSTLVKPVAWYSMFYGWFSSPAGFVHSGIHMPWKTCYLLAQSTTLSIHVSERLSSCRIGTVKDGLARLDDGFTAGDMSDIVGYLCTC